MAQQGQGASPPSSPQISNAKTSTQARTSSPRLRSLGRISNLADVSSPARLRRSSTLSVSDSVDDARQSIKSSTDDLLLPRAKSPELESNHESSHWHSYPLALALLPALGGIFFEGGSAVVTDVTLLGLAAIFLNWSVRLPWDWYHSTQSIRIQEAQVPPDENASDTIIEEASEEDEQTTKSASPKPSNKERFAEPSEQLPTQTSATTELRVHENAALVTCFAFPFLGAWLLHHIRSQLSRPSEGLVSNYNLTIFVLAAELRPLSHLIKIVQARTLHLQRILSSNPYSPQSVGLTASTINDLQSRLAEIETHTANVTLSTKSPPPDVTNQVRKSLQPDLDALNRAIRRYEKRTTILSLQTESRLQELEKRMGDAITLAAAAERSSHSSRQRRGSSVAVLFDWATIMALLPLQLGWTILAFPGRMVGEIVRRAEGYVGQKVKTELQTAGKSDGRVNSGSEKRRGQGRGQKKAF